MIWRVRRVLVTASTNQDARTGQPGEVFVADSQTAGRGRLGHRWLAPSGTALLMSAVLPTFARPEAEVATLPLVAGLAVARAVRSLLPTAEMSAAEVRLKWPNDVLVGGLKLAGILCERVGDNVIVGIGLNVAEAALPPEVAARAVSLASLSEAAGIAAPTRAMVERVVLRELGVVHETWLAHGFAAMRDEIDSLDFLRGRVVSVRQTDCDPAPVRGVANGIGADGSLDVGGERIYAGEAHVEEIG